jgi:hypothetical protein
VLLGLDQGVTYSRAKEYRRLAEECRAMARTVSTEHGRAHASAMAAVWERLADEQSQGSDLSTRPAPTATPEQPAVQQQQQIQPDGKKEKE